MTMLTKYDIDQEVWCNIDGELQHKIAEFRVIVNEFGVKILYSLEFGIWDEFYEEELFETKEELLKTL